MTERASTSVELPAKSNSNRLLELLLSYKIITFHAVQFVWDDSEHVKVNGSAVLLVFDKYALKKKQWKKNVDLVMVGKNGPMLDSYLTLEGR